MPPYSAWLAAFIFLMTYGFFVGQGGGGYSNRKDVRVGYTKKKKLSKKIKQKKNKQKTNKKTSQKVVELTNNNRPGYPSALCIIKFAKSKGFGIN